MSRLDWVYAIPPNFLTPILTALALSDDSVIAEIVRRMTAEKVKNAD